LAFVPEHEIAERLGHTRAAELVFLSEPVSAQHLRAGNVANRVVDDVALGEAERRARAAPCRYSKRMSGQQLSRRSRVADGAGSELVLSRPKFLVLRTPAPLKN